MRLHCSSDLPDGWEFQEIHTLEQIGTIRPLWQTMRAAESRPVLESDIDRYVSVLTASKETKPYVLVLRQNNQPRAMVIGWLGTEKLPIRFGYKTIMKPTIKCLSVIYGGVLGQPDEQVSSILIRGLMGILRQGEMGGIGFNHLRIDSPFYQQIRRITPFLCRNHFPVIDLHWRMSMPKSLDEFLVSRSKNTRKDFRNTLNKLTKTFNKKVKFLLYTTSEEVPQAAKDAAYISQNTYQIPLGSGFIDTYQKRALLYSVASKGWLRLCVLYIDKEPAAFEYVLKCDNICFGQATAYDPKWQKWNVGTFTLLKTIELLCQEKKSEYFDFGFGDAKYKRSFANESWLEAKATYLFAPRFYTLFINSLISLNGAFTIGMTWVVRKLGIYAWIKRIWRKKLKKVAMHNKQES